jgi:protocatechuate 3,4-dioxygenase beta subunit
MSEANINRRQALKLGFFTAGATVISSSMGLAQQICGLTPKQPEGPFYPVADQLDKDTDLVTIKGNSKSAKGEIIFVAGTVSDASCNPIAGALVEIWQACQSGKYNHPGDPNTAELDPNFQYWGKAITDAAGKYKFRTIIPGAYPADTDWMRPPHIHFKVQKLGYHELITQMYFSGDKLNDQDLILQNLSKSEQEQVVVSLAKDAGETYPVANFNISLNKVTTNKRRNNEIA